MGISNIQWSTIKEEARNAAVNVHMARKQFLETEGERKEEHRIELLKARDAWADKVLEFQCAVTDGLDLSVTEDELPDPEDGDVDLIGDEPAEGTIGTEKPKDERQALLDAEQKRPEYGTPAYDGGPNAKPNA